MKRERIVTAIAALLSIGLVACGEEGPATSSQGLGTTQPAVCAGGAAGEVPALPPPPLPPPGACDAGVLPESTLGSYDANQDGELSLDELCAFDHDTQGKVPSFAGPMPFVPPPPKDGATQAGPAPLGGLENAYRDHLRDVLWIYDVDDSKGLSAAERAQLRTDAKSGCQQQVARVLAAFDTNTDGSLGETERAAAEQAIKSAMDEYGTKLLAAFDANGDGSLDETEHAAMMEKAKAGAEAQRKELEKKYDVDSSGQLEASERAALRSFLRQRVVEGC